MKGHIGYKLSPNEQARLLKEARETLRKQRLLQVREQAKRNAAKIRQDVKKEKQRQLNKLAKQIENEWNKEKEEKLQTLHEVYEHSLKHVGEAHLNALHKESQEDNKQLVAEVDSQRAEIRHKKALRKLHQEYIKQQQEANRHIIARQTALELEKARAAQIASKPQPKLDPVEQINVPKVRPVKFTDLDAFSSTHYHIPDACYVEKADCQEQVNAHELAKSENEKLTEMEEEKKRSQLEQHEKARLRYKHALKKELLKQDYATMLHDLSDLQRADMHRRQQVVAKIPKQIFIPPHRRLEEKEDIQREMETAFEDMYMKATEYFGDLSLALDPHPPPETPSVTETLDLSVQDQDLSVPGDGSQSDHDTRVKGPLIRDLTSQTKPGHSGQDKVPEGLCRLLDRIKAQRELAQKTPAHVTEEMMIKDDQGKPSPASTVPSLSQHPVTDTSPSSLVETGSMSTGTLQSTGTSSMSQNMQSTVSSVSTTTNETDKSESITLTASSDEGSQLVMSGPDQTSRDALVNVRGNDQHGNEVLLHPLEQADQVRQRAFTEINSSHYLLNDKQRQSAAQCSDELKAIKRETSQSQKELEEQKRLLEEKLQNIERQRLLLLSKMKSSASGARHGDLDPVQSLSSSSTLYPPHLPSNGSTLIPSSHVPVTGNALPTRPLHQDIYVNQPSTFPFSFQKNKIFGAFPSGVSSGGVSFVNSTDITASSGTHGKPPVDAYRNQLSEHPPDKPLGKDIGYSSHILDELHTSQQQMAKRAEQLLIQDTGKSSRMGKADQIKQREIFAPVTAELSQTPMTASSTQSGDEQSAGSVQVSGITEMDSSPRPFGNLESRFSELEERLQRTAARMNPEDPDVASFTQFPLSKHSSENSFDSQRRELELQLIDINRRKAIILEDSQVQKDFIQNMKNQWFALSPDSDNSNKPAWLTKEEQQKSADPIRNLSFSDSTLKEPPDNHNPERRFLLCHPQESNSFSKSTSNLDSYYENHYTWPVLHRSNVTDSQTTRSDDAPKSGRTWHAELLECSMSSGNSSDKKPPSAAAASKDPLVFEVHGVRSPLLLRYRNEADASSSKQFASTPVKEVTPSKKDQLKSTEITESDQPPHTSTLSRETTELQRQETSTVQQLSDINNQTSPSVGEAKHDLSDFSQHVMSEDNSTAPPRWSSEMSQFTLSGNLDGTSLTSQEVGHGNSEKFKPLAEHQSMQSDEMWNSREQSDTSRQQRRPDVESDISKRIEESLTQHHIIMEETRRIMNQHNAAGTVQSHTGQLSAPQRQDDYRTALEALTNEPGLSDEPDITLVSLDSTVNQTDVNNDDDNNNSHCQPSSMTGSTGRTPRDTAFDLSTTGSTARTPRDTAPDLSTTGSMARTPLDTAPDLSTSSPASTTASLTSVPRSPVAMSVMFRDPAAGLQGLDHSTNNQEDWSLDGSNRQRSEIPASESQAMKSSQLGRGAKPKQVQFEITDDTADASRTLNQPRDSGQRSTDGNQFVSIHIQHLDGSSTDEYEGLSLREAFMKKKRDFIEASERRKKKAEAKARRNTAKSQQHGTALTKTLASWKKSRKLNPGTAAKKVDQTKIEEKTSESRKLSEKEMKTRTSRLYSQLEEVKQKKLEEERKKMYAMNREKAKAFYQKLDAHKKH